MPEDEIEIELAWKDMPLSVKIGIPVSLVLAVVALVLERLF